MLNDKYITIAAIKKVIKRVKISEGKEKRFLTKELTQVFPSDFNEL